MTMTCGIQHTDVATMTMEVLRNTCNKYIHDCLIWMPSSLSFKHNIIIIYHYHIFMPMLQLLVTHHNSFAFLKHSSVSLM